MPLVTIQDTVTYFDGSVASGQIILTWPPFIYAGVAVAAGQQAYPIAPDGTVTIICYPNIGAQPQGVYYTATYELDKGAVYDEYWLVPATPSVNTIGAVRAQFPATPSIMINAQQLTGGGALSGQFLGWSGSNWVPMYVSNFNCAVRSFFGRIGDVMPQTGDYTVDQVTGAVSQTRQVLAGPGLYGGGPLSADVTLAVAPATTVQLIRVSDDGTVVGARPEVNFIAGDEMAITVYDNMATNRVDVTFVSLGGGGGGTTVIYAVDGALIGSQPVLNLISGANIALSGQDDGSDTINITIAGESAFWQGNPDGSISYDGGNVRIGQDLSVAGDVNIDGSLTVNGVPIVPFSQTPWLSDIDGAAFRLLNAGNVGIGNPASPVPNPADNAYWLMAGTLSSSTFGALAMVANANSPNAAMGELAFANYAIPGTDKRIAMIVANLDGSVVNSGNLLFYTYSAGAIAERMRITSAGLVGIGAPPSTVLDVAGSIRSTANPHPPTAGVGMEMVYAAPAGRIQVYDRTGAAYGPLAFEGLPIYMNVNSGGFVGIGTANPTTALTVFGNGQVVSLHAGVASSQLYMLITNGNNTTYIGVEPAAGGSLTVGGLPYATVINAAASTALQLGTQNNARLTITPAGLVGIGLTNPQNPLEVAGAIKTNYFFKCNAESGFEWWLGPGFTDSSGNLQFVHRNASSGAWTLPMVIATNGFVGLGANNPPDALTIYNGSAVMRIAAPGGYGTIFYQDSTYFYILVTNNGDPLGGWNALRPFMLNLSNGNVSINHGLVVSGGASVTGQIVNSGTIWTYQTSAPTTGLIYFGNAATAYIYFTGSTFAFTAGIDAPGGFYMSGNPAINASGVFVSGSGIDTRGVCAAAGYAVYDSGGTRHNGYNGYVTAWGSGGQLLVVNGLICV